MGLQRGNVETNPGKVPEPWMTVEDFREKLTEKHREALLDLILEEEKRRINFHKTLRLSQEAAEFNAHEDTRIYREILQCIAGIHPPPYTW